MEAYLSRRKNPITFLMPLIQSLNEDQYQGMPEIGEHMNAMSSCVHTYDSQQ